MADHEMIQYFRGDGNHPVGVAVAHYKEETHEVRIGWSKCNKKDQFDKAKGLKIARARAEHGSEVRIPCSREFTKSVLTPLPDGESDLTLKVIPPLPDQYMIFIMRVVTYFKSVNPDQFVICGPVEDQMDFVNLVIDARNDDIDRQRIRSEQAKA